METVNLFSSAVILCFLVLTGTILFPAIKGVTEEVSWAIRLALAIGLLFLIGWVDFVMNLRWWSSLLLLPLSLFVFIVRFIEVKALFTSKVMRPVLIAYLLLLGILLLHMSVQVLYFGGGWAVDWIEHYHRASFFGENRDFGTKFAGYALTARPPLVNILAAQMLSIFGVQFFTYQVVMTLYGSLLFFPLAGLISHFKNGEVTKRSVFLLAFLLAGTPMFIQNIVFPWTKMVCSVFVLSGLLVFLKYLSSNGWRWAGLAYMLMGFAFVAHYSAGPYIVGMVAAQLFWHRKRWRDYEFAREFMVGGITGALVVFLWWGWALHIFGIAGTFLTNTTITASTGEGVGGFLAKVCYNMWTTFVPYSWRAIPAWAHEICLAPDGLLALRDQFFNLYQVNFFWAIGPGVCAIWLYALFQKRVWASFHQEGSLVMFWFVYGAISLFLGVAVHGAIDHMGLAHICLQPIVYMIIAHVAAVFFEQPRYWKIGLIGSWGMGWFCGVQLNVMAQGFINLSSRSPLYYFDPNNVPFNLMNNLRTKVDFSIEMVGDLWPYPSWAYLSLSILLLLVLAYLSCQCDEKHFFLKRAFG